MRDYILILTEHVISQFMAEVGARIHGFPQKKKVEID
jgi:hypothetical protein